MVAKRIVSKDAADPGNVMHAALEIMPERAVLEQGKTATVRVLYEEKPMKGIKCTIYNRDWQGLLMTKTDEEGKVSFVADKPGMYVVIAKYTDESKAVSDEFDETSFTTTPLLVFSATTDAKSVPEDSDAMTVSKTSRSNI